MKKFLLTVCALCAIGTACFAGCSNSDKVGNAALKNNIVPHITAEDIHDENEQTENSETEEKPCPDKRDGNCGKDRMPRAKRNLRVNPTHERFTDNDGDENDDKVHFDGEHRFDGRLIHRKHKPRPPQPPHVPEDGDGEN